MDKVKIPLSFVLEIDDVGWDDGRDLRCEGKASRSGLPRNHDVADYEFVRKLAEVSGKNIAVALVLGDWDKDNILRGEVGFTHDPNGWNRADEIDISKFEKIKDILDNGNLDFMVHAILHGRYDELGKRINENEFVISHYDENGRLRKYIPSEEDFRHRLDVFFKLYRSWGFKKKIEGFVNPGYIYGADEKTVQRMCSVLADYGIKYWIDQFGYPEFDCPLKVYHGVVCAKYRFNRVKMPWDACDIDPDTLALYYEDEANDNACIQGSHLTNYLRYDPKKNEENLAGWLRFYKRNSEVYGSMLADDLASSVNQLFYHTFAKVKEENGKIIVDLTDVEKNKIDCHVDEFFISFRRGFVPVNCIGGEISLCEKHNEFDTYKIKHEKSKVEITFSLKSEGQN